MSTTGRNRMQPISGGPELTVTRTFAAELEAVWRSWTTPEGLATWWWSSWPDTRYEVDARVGGRYRIDAPAHGIGVRGEYLDVAPLDSLAFTWIWLEDGVDGDVENVTVTFTQTLDGTRIDLRHTGPWTTQEPAENYRQGWEHVLASLAEIPSA